MEEEVVTKNFRVKVRRIWGYDADGSIIYDIEAAGNSTWAKPTEASVGGHILDCSTATESDTGYVYFWNEETKDWVPQFSFQS